MCIDFRPLLYSYRRGGDCKAGFRFARPGPVHFSAGAAPAGQNMGCAAGGQSHFRRYRVFWTTRPQNRDSPESSAPAPCWFTQGKWHIIAAEFPVTSSRPPVRQTVADCALTRSPSMSQDACSDRHLDLLGSTAAAAAESPIIAAGRSWRNWPAGSSSPKARPPTPRETSSSPTSPTTAS